MMRENESDGDSGWVQPPGNAGPSAPGEAGHGADEPTLTRRQAASPPPSPQQQDYPDTIAFGTPAGSGRGSQPDYGAQAGYGDQAGHPHPGAYGNQSGYGNRARSGNH